MRRETRKTKKGKGKVEKKFSGPSLSRALLLTLTISAPWLHVFTNYPGMQKGAKLGDLAFIYILTGLCFSCSLFFPSRTESKMEFQEAKKKQSRNRSSNKIPEWASRRDAYGCRAVVMSLSAHLLWLPSCLWRSMRAELFVCVYVCLQDECVCRSRGGISGTYFQGARRRKNSSNTCLTTFFIRLTRFSLWPSSGSCVFVKVCLEVNANAIII